jgi:hypothetical protein
VQLRWQQQNFRSPLNQDNPHAGIVMHICAASQNGTTDTDAVVEAATKSIAAGAATAAALLLLLLLLLLQIHDQHHTPQQPWCVGSGSS